MRDLSYPATLRALNNLAYDTAKACPTEEGKRQLRHICFELDALVEALPSRMDLDFHGETPVFRVEGARI